MYEGSEIPFRRENKFPAGYWLTFNGHRASVTYERPSLWKRLYMYLLGFMWEEAPDQLELDL